MPEYVFSNSKLEEIDNSILKLIAEIKSWIALISLFLPSNRAKNLSTNQKNRSIPMEDRTAVLPEEDYVHPVTLESFTEINDPVIDSEGHIRDKNEPYIGKGIYSGKPVETTESSDLKKIQSDYRNIHNSINEMKNMFSQYVKESEERRKESDAKVDALMKELKEHKIIIAEQNIRLERQEIRISEQNNQISELKISLHERDIKISLQETQISDLKNEVVSLRSENSSLKKQLHRLDRKSEKNLLLLTNLEDKNAKSEFETIPLVGLQAKSAPWKPGMGFLDTVAYDAPCREHKKIQEQLKAAAYDGDEVVLRRILYYNKKMDINGRGMPDSICSIARGFKDKNALMLAAKQNHVNCVKILVEKGAEVNYLDRNNYSALDYSIKNKNKELHDFLNKHGAVSGCKVVKSLENNDNANDSAGSFRMVPTTDKTFKIR